MPSSSAADQPEPEDRDHALEAFLEALAGDDPERLYDRAPCGYLTTTPAGLIAKVNQTFLTLSGYDRADLVGKRRFVDLLTAGGRIYHETHFAPMLQMQKTAREIALDLVCVDGRRLPVLVNSVLEDDAEGTPLAIRTAVFDASQRRQYELELLRAKQRAEESEAQVRALAQILQQSFIPPDRPRIPGLELAGAYRPSGDGTEIGGDFYDVFEIGPDDWCVVIGDVCGKGVGAAVVTSLARHTVRAAAVRQSQPSAALHTLNEVLLHHETDRFCTVAVVRLRRNEDRTEGDRNQEGTREGIDGQGHWTVTLSSGGHPRPILLQPGRPPQNLGRFGSLVGGLDGPHFTDTTFDLHPGDAILLYTDGITEARSPAGQFYGEERLVAALGDRPVEAATIVDGLLHEVMEFQANKPRDDIAIVAIVDPAHPR